MSQSDIDKKYDSFWKEIVENPDGTLNKEQLKKELYDFSQLIGNLSALYCYITGDTVSKPMTDTKCVLGLFEEKLREAYNDGYVEGVNEECEDW